MQEFQFGVYHYSYVSSLENAVLEAKNCLKFINGKKFDLPVFYDLEESSIIKLGRDTITKCAIAFCEEIQKAGLDVGNFGKTLEASKGKVKDEESKKIEKNCKDYK